MMLVHAATGLTIVVTSNPALDVAGNTVTTAQIVLGGGAVNTTNNPVNVAKYTYSLLLDAADLATTGYAVLALRDAVPTIVGTIDIQAVSFDPLGPNYAGGGSDPWLTALPGAYVAGEAGYILGTNLNALITSRSATGAKMDLVDAPNAVAGAALAADLLALADGIETGLTPKQALRAMAAALAGLLTVSGTTVTIKGLGVATTRLTATTDAQGQRTVVTPSL